MIGKALGTAAGIRLAKKLEEQEEKKKTEKIRKKEKFRENLEINSRAILLKAVRKDLSEIYSDEETIDFFYTEIITGLKYLNVSYDFYNSTWRNRLFTVSKFGGIDSECGFDIEPLAQAVEKKQQREAKALASKETVAKSNEQSIMSVDELHQKLVKELSISEYKELFKLMRAELEV